MSDSDLTDGAEVPQAPDLAEAKTKLQSATDRLRQLNEETQAAPTGAESTAESSKEAVTAD